jgi:hypothetical protein
MKLFLRQKPYTPVLMLMLAISLSISLAGCSRQVRVAGEWQEGASRDQSFTRVLVVGLLADAGQRCDFEMFMETQLRSTGADAKASCFLMDITAPVTFESVGAAVDEYGADAVLTTVLVQSAMGEQYGGDRESRGGVYFKATGTGYESFYYRGGYGGYGVPVVYGEFREAPVITTVAGAVEILSTLYATRDASPVYTLITTATDLRSRESALAAITPPIAERLQRDGLLR